MNENLILLLLPGVAVLIILLLKDRISGAFRRRQNPPDVIDPAYRASLLSPDWAFYERHLQRAAPAALRQLYSDMALMISVSESYRGKREEINCFVPLKEDGLLDTHDEIGHDIVPIATSTCGDPIYLRPGASEADTVYIAYHDDPGNIEVFADSVAQMLAKAPKVNPAA